jgi:hypothetical protein
MLTMRTCLHLMIPDIQTTCLCPMTTMMTCGKSHREILQMILLEVHQDLHHLQHRDM